MKEYLIVLPESLATIYEEMAKNENRPVELVLVEWLKTLAHILGR